MKKDIQKPTQNERLDLTDKQFISGKEAYAKAVMANLQTPYKEVEKIIEFPLKQVIDNQERVIKDQKYDIERLQKQLDREIKINRKMKRVLEKYASMEIELDDSYDSFTGTHWSDGYIDKKSGDVFTKLANNVLEEIENKE